MKTKKLYIVIIMFILISNCAEIPINKIQTNKSKIIISEFGYKAAYGGGFIDVEYEYITLQFNKKEAYRINGFKSIHGEKTERREKISLIKYLNLLNELEKNSIWELKTIDIHNPYWIQNDKYKKDLDPYEKYVEMHDDTYEFFIKVGDNFHSYLVYAPEKLKDKRYKNILDSINKIYSDLSIENKNKKQ